ncbi:hypothetical protein DLM75_13470 [Leptospira stimsonii]|uniref:Uncharacterized protein n=1 Tax=Leptospira stimsonii TaxID=2202203 RepID=A0A396Z3B2_9LEPT|nr:hypothetical protein DLM75_13470 [Leptospira stimsonii]
MGGGGEVAGKFRETFFYRKKANSATKFQTSKNVGTPTKFSNRAFPFLEAPRLFRFQLPRFFKKISNADFSFFLTFVLIG